MVDCPCAINAYIGAGAALREGVLVRLHVANAAENGNAGPRRDRFRADHRRGHPVTLPTASLVTDAVGSNGETVMDAKNTNVTPWPKQGLSDHVRAAPAPVQPRPSREQAEN